MNLSPPPSFLRACGLNGPFALAVVSPDGRSASHVFEQPFTLLGRHPGNSINLPEGDISQRHAYLQVIGGRLYCIDLGSRSGIYRGANTFTSGWIDPGEEIRIGPYRIICTSLPAAANGRASSPDPLVQRVAEPGMLPDVSVEIMQETVRLSRWRMNRCLVLVGHDPSARLRLRDRTVSRYHCALVGSADGVWVVDLLGRGGTLRNGLPVAATRLSNGDLLQVGGYELSFTCQASLWPRQPTLLPTAPPAALVPAPRPNRAVVPLPPPVQSDGTGLLPILQQLGMQQQAMMDQFQQSMLMMVQMFMKMHSDQMDLVRDELEQIRDLTTQIQAAHQQLHARPAPPPPVPPRPAAAPIVLPPPEVTPAPTVGDDEDAAVHTWLNGQIEDLERQRQSVWQRVVGVLFGR